MKKKLPYQLILTFLFFLPFNVVGQIENNNLKSYQKSMKFVDFNTIEEAKEKFMNEFDLDSNTTFIEFQSNSDKRGGVHKKYQQYYKGVKVEYGTMIVHLSKGKVTLINGELYDPKGLDLVTKLTPSIALNKAMNHVKAKTYLWESSEQSKLNSYKKPEGELVIFPVIENGNSILKLAYKFDIYATTPISRGYVYINAANGGFLFNDPIIKHVNNEYSAVNISNKLKIKNKATALVMSGTADTRYSGNRSIEAREEANGTFTLNDDIRNVHTYNAQNSPTNGTYQFTKVDFVDNDNVWTSAEYDNAARDNAALDAHWGAMKVYDFWNMLGRNSINDAGMEIRSYVHVGTDYFNAFWNGSVMSYGDGTPNPLTSIDIVSHEMAHGVTTWTANLVYARESGAMNEGFSDIFGAAVEFFAKRTGTDSNPNAETWLLAEEFWPGGFLRSMSDPKSKGDPDTYNGTNYTDATSNCIPSSSNDYCGVHSNSGVLNHWFYILVTGKAGSNDAGDIFDVTGIGMTKAQEIAYLTLRDYLSPNSTFIDARNGAIEVAASLYGSNSSERQATQDAFYAVNVGNKFIPFDTDINLVEFTELVDITCGGDVIPKILVRNSGAISTINTIQINYSIDGVSQTPFNWNGTLNINEETEITLPVINEVTIKTYTLEVEAIVTGDGDVSNNTITSPFRVNRDDSTPTQVNTFDNFLVDYWLTYNEGEGSNLWLIANPDKANLNTVTSGTNAYVTEKTADYPNETKAYLISPCYDLTAFANPKMKFNMAFQLQENFDIIYVEYSTDAVNWSLLGSSTDPNWYNSNRIFESGEISSDCQNCPGAQWTGVSSVFSEYSYDLSSFKNESNIIFRFVFHSDASITDEGVVIDDFVIEELGVLVDDDNDGIQNSLDLCPGTLNGEDVNSDGCSDSQLDDDDDDGVQNSDDICVDTPNGATVDANGCSDSQLDDDDDDVQNSDDNCADTPNGETVDANGCSDSQLDDDNDGVMNNIDVCLTSTAGVSVDATGCFTLPSNNFNIEVTSETCPNKENGQVTIVAIESYSYTTTINGVPYTFSNTSNLTSNPLPVGVYDFCISVSGESYEQCFVIEIEPSNSAKATTSVSSNKVSIEMTAGTAPYTISVNGLEQLKTSASIFLVAIKHGDVIEVKTAKTCEGVYSKTIEILEGIVAYPNPTNGTFEIALPVSQKEVTIELYTIHSQLISVKIYPIVYGKVQLTIKDQPTGLYIAKVQLDIPVTLKIVKQ